MGSNPLAGVPSVGVGGSGPGSGLYHYVMPQVGFVFLLALAVLAVWYFLLHKQTMIVKLFFSALFVGVLALDPKAIGSLISWVAGLVAQL
jgi:hypothetical protein